MNSFSNSISENNSQSDNNKNEELNPQINYRRSNSLNFIQGFFLKNEMEAQEKKIKRIYKYTLIAFKEKKYDKIISIISNNENLFYKNSPNSFNILKMKIRVKLKRIKIIYEQIYLGKNKIQYTNLIEKQLLSIQQDFDKLMDINDNSNEIQEEICNQIYCHILLDYSILWKLRKDYLKSLSYVNLGLNLLKIFFLKYGKANEIGTYSIYCKLYLLCIHLLILDTNIDLAINYENNLFNLLNICFKILKDKEQNVYHKKLSEYLFINFVFFGICFECIGKTIESMNAYKFAYDLLKNENLFSNKKFYDLITNIYHQINLKIQNKENNTIRTLEINKFYNDKKDKLSMIANGYKINPYKFKKVEDNIMNNILSPQIKEKIKTLDKELEILVYSNKNFNKELYKNNKHLSPEIKNNLKNYKIYSTLLSKEHKDLILKNNFYLNDPEGEKETIDRINSYLCNKMTITNYNNKEQNSFKNLSNTPNRKKKLIFKRVNSENILPIKINLKFLKEKNNKIPKSKILHNNKSSKSLFSISRPLNNDFEKKNLTGRNLSRNFFTKYMKLEKLTTQELDFQKTLLNIRSSESKYYFSQHSKEMLFSEENAEKKAIKSYLFIQNKFKKEKKFEFENKKKININSEKSYNIIFQKKKNLFTNGFNKVFKNYQNQFLKDRREQEKCDDINYVNLRNEKNILKLDSEIDYLSKVIKKKKNVQKSKSKK